MFMLLLRFMADNIRSNRVELKCSKFKVGKTFKVGKPFQLKEQLSTGINFPEKFSRMDLTNSRDCLGQGKDQQPPFS